MPEQLDPRPVFTIVMGCDGAGKSAWKRKNYDLLPSRYFDQDSFAGGIGDWNSSEAHTRARVYIDAQIAESIDQRLDFGTKSTDSDKPGSALVERVIKAGYRVEGIYFGTNDPQINIDRIEHRVFARTGHMVDPKRIPERWRHSLSSLHSTAERFDLLRLFDNSEHDEFHLPRPVEQCQLERGRVTWQREALVPWCVNWLQGLAELQRHKAKLTHRTPLGQLDKTLDADHGAGATVGWLRDDSEDPKADRGNYDIA